MGSAERGVMLAECGASRATTSLPRGRFFLIVAGRFPAVKNNLNLIRTANKAGGCCISSIRIAHTPGVERGNELAHAAHDLPRPSAATKASSKVVPKMQAIVDGGCMPNYIRLGLSAATN